MCSPWMSSDRADYFREMRRTVSRLRCGGLNLLKTPEYKRLVDGAALVKRMLTSPTRKLRADG
jgi:hypothetical protein